MVEEPWRHVCGSGGNGGEDGGNDGEVRQNLFEMRREDRCVG